MEKRNNKSQYPPAPTPDELKKHSKKYILVGGIIIAVLIIATVAFLMIPKEVPPPITPPEIIEEAAPELGIINLIACAEYNEKVECITPKKSFTQDETIIISYRVTGIELTQVENMFRLTMVKTITITDSQGNEVDYTKPGFAKQKEVQMNIAPDIGQVLTREILDASYLDVGAYTVTIEIGHNGKTVQEQVQVEVI